MLELEIPVEQWSGSVRTAVLGATAAEGGTRTSTVTIGGDSTLPFLTIEGVPAHRPALALEVLDVAPGKWPAPLEAALGDVSGDPAAWAAKCVEQYHADLIVLRLLSADPQGQNASADSCAATVRRVLDAVGVPLVLWGCGDPDKDSQVLPACSLAAAGERCLLGTAVQNAYRTIAACALADKHLVISEAPLDISIQKQVNILLSEQGLPDDRVVMYQVTGALGYGVEYAYSILERTRLAALGGDKMLSAPMLSVVGSEAWKAKEAWMEEPAWGPLERRGLLWEAATAELFLHAGTHLLVFWHPEALALTRGLIDDLS
jgi:acetyl-CoA decarbonylase/synthase complex subunit delta